MQPEFFWTKWAEAYKNTYLLFLTLFIASILWMTISYISGFQNILDWNILAEADKAEVIVDNFKIGPFNLTQVVDNTIFYQKYSGTTPIIQSNSYYVFALVISVVGVLLLTIISTFSKYWYYLGIALFAFFLTSLKMESLLLFGSSEKIGLIICLLIYLPTSYYFNRIRKDISLTNRFLIFIFITLIFAIFIEFFAETPNPLFYLSTSMMSSAMILSLAFVFTVAHEIIAAFVYIIYGKGKSSKNGFIHLIIISVIYLINLTFAYLFEKGSIEWDFLYVNVFLLLVISSVLGIWGFKEREEQYKFLTSFCPTGALLYLGLGIVCFTTIGHLQTTGNDPGIEIFRDFILYSHLAFGLIFLFYLIANFITLLRGVLPVYKVIYKPVNMPYFTFRFAGFILVIALVLKTNWQVPVYQSVASHYNAVADVHMYNGESLLGERYYQQASNYALHNHKANYSLAKIAEKASDTERAIVKYKDAIKKYPSPQAYINLTNLYAKENRFFDALFNMQEAKNQFSDDIKVLNTLGIIYSKTDYTDSAIYYLDKAAKLDANNWSAVSNILAILSKKEVKVSIDSVVKEYGQFEDPIFLNNEWVLSSQTGKYFDRTFTPEDSSLSILDATRLINQSFNALLGSDTVKTNHLLAFANNSKNFSSKEGLEYVACLGLYKNGDVNQAFRKLNWLANTSEKISAKYFDDIGLWALEQGANSVAIDYFQWSKERGYEDAALHLAIALSENHDVQQAIKKWKELSAQKDVGIKTISQQMVTILTLPPSEINNAKDNEKYLFSRYVLTHRDTVMFNEILASISDPNYKAQAILDMSRKLWENDYNEAAISMYSNIKDLEIIDEKLFNEIQFFELKMLANQKNIRGLAQKINQGLIFDNEHLTEKAYYSGLISEANGDTTTARINYKFIAKRNPFFEEAVIDAARFFGEHKPFEAYHVLLSALEVNPKSIKLLKAYIIQCATVQQNSSAEIALETLKSLITQKEHGQVKLLYNKRIKSVKQEWDSIQ